MKQKHRMTWILVSLVLLAQPTSAFIDLINPEDGAHLSNDQVSFDYYPELNNSINECSLEANGDVIIIDEEVQNSEINSFKTNNTPAGKYNWSVLCSNENESEQSDTQSFVMDKQAPEVNLNEPENDTTLESGNFSFSATDDHSNNMTCQIEIDGETRKNITAYHNTLAREEITGLADGWSVSCTDRAGNNGTSEKRVFQNQVEREYKIELNKQEFSPGERPKLEINAPTGTNLTLEVCPEGDGFVECFSAITLKEKEYPVEEVLPKANKSGKYIVDAYFAFRDDRVNRKVNYTVLNTLEVSIEGNTDLKTGEQTTLEGKARGGTGALTYKWNTHNGNTKNGKKLKLNFSSQGEYEETLTVEDQAGNSAQTSTKVTVQKAYEITVKVRDKNDNALEAALVEIGQEEAETGSEGTASLKVRKGDQDMSVFMKGYELHESQVNVNKKKTLTIRLEKKKKTNKTFSIKRVGPDDGQKGKAGKVTFQFKASGVQGAACRLLTRQNGSFRKRVERNISKDTKYNFRTKLGPGSYDWKVTCEQGGKEVSTEIATLKLTSEKQKQVQTTESSPSEFDKKKYVQKLENVLNNYASMSTREKRIAEKLGYQEDVKDALTHVKRAQRDIHDLQFRTDLSDKEKDQKRKQIRENAIRDFRNAVQNVNIKDSKSFVAYPKKEALGYVLNQTFNNLQQAEQTKEAVMKLQGKMVVSAKTVTLDLEKVSGEKQTVTAVIKEIKTKNITGESYLVEHIPKELAENLSQITFLEDYEVIANDPVVRFPMQDEIVYYIHGKRELEDTKQINTWMLQEHLQLELDEITGSATMMSNVEFNLKTFLITLVVFLLMIYGFSVTGLWSDVLSAVSTSGSEEELRNIRELVNDALTRIDEGDFHEASLIYREVRLTFKELPAQVQKQVYDEVIDLINKIDIAYSRQVSEKIEESLEKDDHKTAQELYKKLKGTYEKLDKEYQKEIYGKVKEIARKIES